MSIKTYNFYCVNFNWVIFKVILFFYWKLNNLKSKDLLSLVHLFITRSKQALCVITFFHYYFFISSAKFFQQLILKITQQINLNYNFLKKNPHKSFSQFCTLIIIMYNVLATTAVSFRKIHVYLWLISNPDFH